MTRITEFTEPETVVDITAIADRMGVPKNTVNVWRTRGVLPDPDLSLAVGPLWYWSTIEAWAAATGRM